MEASSNRAARTRRSAAWLALSAAVLGSIVGCREETPLARVRRLRGRRPSAAQQKNPLIEQARASLGSLELQQVNGGPGLLIADPEPSGADPAIRNLGRGFARWLRLAVSSQPELGRTPLWMTSERVLLQLEERKARVDLDEAARFAKSAGVTHAALGQITGSGSRRALSFQVYQVPERTPVGAPVKLEGSVQEVTAQLPEVARQLAQRLGVSQPRVPNTTEESAAELQFLGSLPRSINEVYTPAQDQRLGEIANHSRLAALVDLDHSSTLHDEARKTRRARQLAEREPENPFIWSTIEIANYAFPDQNSPAAWNERIDALCKRYPGSYTAYAAKAYARTRERTYADVVKLMEETQRRSTQNPDGWFFLGNLISRQSDQIRDGRYYSALSASEREVLPKLYDRWVSALRKTVQLDPDYSGAWEELASAATFSGDEPTANQAIWKVLNRPNPSTNSFWWAFEMYDDKWFGDRQNRARVAQRATEVKFQSARERLYMGRLLQTQGFPKQAQQLLPNTAERATLAQVPTRSPRVHFTPASIQNNRPTVPVVKNHPANVQLLFEHSNGAKCVAWSPDGMALASGGRDHVVRIWRWGGKDALQLQGHARAVNAVAWSRDGRRLASASSDGTVRLWDVDTGKTLQVLNGGGKPVRVLTWSPTADTLASGGDDRLIHLWNGQTGATEGTLKGHQGRIRYLSFSPDGSHLASVADEMTDDRLCFWTTDSAHTLKRVPAELASIYALSWRPDGRELAAVSPGHFSVFTPDGSQEMREIPYRGYDPFWFAWSQDAHTLLAASSMRRFYLVDLSVQSAPTTETRKQLEAMSVPDHTQHALAFAWNPKHQRLATAGSDGQVLLWDLTKTPLSKMN